MPWVIGFGTLYLGKMILNNKKVRYDYTIIDRFDAGLVLVGSEVKSLKKGEASITQAYCVFIENELYIQGMYIKEPSSGGNIFSHELTRRRKLLLTRKQLDRLEGKINQKGMTIVPLNVFKTKTGLIKITIGLAKGKTHYDRRNKLKDAAIKKDMNEKLHD